MPSKGGGRAPVEVSAEVKDFIELFGKSSQVPQKLRTALRKKMKAAAERAAQASRSHVEQAPPSGGGKRSRGLRQGIASGIGVSLTSTTGATKVGVIIKASRAGLPEDMRPLVKAYNKKSWRHPVFHKFNGSKLNAAFGKLNKKAVKALDLGATGRSLKALDRAQRTAQRANAKWVEQKGNPYFEEVIDGYKDDVQRAVLAAMDEARRGLSNKGHTG